MLFIAILASAVILVENVPHALHRLVRIFGSSTDVDALIVALFVVLPLGCVWGGYWYLRRQSVPCGAVAFSGCVLAVFLIMEFFLPYPGPFKKSFFMISEWQDISGTTVEGVTDEPLRSPKGHPIGIRVHYSVKCPRRGPFLIETRFYPVSRLERQDSVEFDSSGVALMEQPGADYAPCPGGNGDKWVNAVPSFIFYRPNIPFCLYGKARDVIEASTLPGQTKYRINIGISGTRTLLDQQSVRTFETQHAYDVRQFYESAVNDLPVCP